MAGENPAKPYIPPNVFGVKQEYWERIQTMRLLDDMMMSSALDQNIEATQLILRILLGKEDLVVTSAIAQREYKNLYGHSLRLDVEARDSIEDVIDIEMQRENRGAKPKRARFHSAMLDTHSLPEGEDYEKLPTSYVIFITEKDYWKKGLPIYRFDRTLTNLDNTELGDCAHIIYVNGAYEGDDPIGLLMADFRARSPSDMNFPELARRVQHLRTSEKEVKKMCQAMETTYNEGLEEGIQKGQFERGVKDLRNLMDSLGMSLVKAMDALNIPQEERQPYINRIEVQ